MEDLKRQLELLRADLQKAKESEAIAVGLGQEMKEEASLLAGKVKELESKDSSKVVYLSRDRKLERLRGTPQSSKDPEVEDWVRDAQSAIDCRHLSGKEAIQYLKDNLTGDARTEVDSRGKVDTVKELFRILRSVFDADKTLPQLRREFYSRTQESDETIVQYSHVLSRIYYKMELKDSTLKGERDTALRSQLAEGLHDSDLRREALRWTKERKGTFFDLRDWAEEWSKQGATTVSKVSVKEAQASVNREDAILDMLKQQNALLQEQIELSPALQNRTV